MTHAGGGMTMWRAEALAGCWAVKTTDGGATMWRAEALDNNSSKDFK